MAAPLYDLNGKRIAVSAVLKRSPGEFPSYDEKNVRQSESRDTGPTGITAEEWGRAYDFFNEKLFGGELPRCLITYQRKRSALGYFHGGHFRNDAGDAVADEIAMNPDWIPGRPLDEPLSTLVHEQCHLWQFHFSAYEKRRGVVRPYHDREWGAKMQAVGLIPSATGQPGGAKTGNRVSHYIAEGGNFRRACAELLATGFAISWQQRWAKAHPREGRRTTRTRDPSKVKFTCPVCRQNAWAKQSAKLACLNDRCACTLMVAAK